MLGPDKIIYLDNNATTRVDPAVVEEMLPFLTTYYGNASSPYRFGAQVRGAIEHARAQVATSFGCEPGEIIFTSGGTESNNSAINSALRLNAEKRHIVTTAVEHSATLRHCETLAQRGYAATYVGVDEAGHLDLDEIERAIRPETAVISVMAANNETGVLFPIDEIAEIARRHRVLFHTDTVQAAGKLPIDLSQLGASTCSISAHKLHGPKGVGALYVNRRAAFRPMLIGGGQENQRRAGTENVAAIVGFGKAAVLAHEMISRETGRFRALRDRFEESLLAAIEGSYVNGDPEQRLPNTSSISFAGIDAAAALMLLDRQNICCSAGSACLRGSFASSHVLRAMNLDDARSRSSLRFSLSRFTTDAEIDRALAMIPKAIAKLRAMSPEAAAISAPAAAPVQ